MNRMINLARFACVVALWSGSLLSAEQILKVHVPFDFVAAGRVLPAGDYAFVESESRGTMFVRGEGAGRSVAVMTYLGAATHGATSETVRFHLDGGRKVLSALVMEDGTERVVTMPSTKEKWTGGGAGGH